MLYALGMTAESDSDASYSEDDQRLKTTIKRFKLKGQEAGVYYFSPNLFKMLKKISPSLLMQEYEKEDSILKKLLLKLTLTSKKS